MPLWQDVARCAGAAAGLGDTATGRAGAGVSCASAAVENATDIASIAFTTRIPGEGVGIDITGE